MICLQKNTVVKDPLVSVIVPYFNRPDTIGKTIDAIMNQRCDFDFELIVGDDYSTENNKEILIEYQNKYPQNIILLLQEENIGLGANWATCVKNSRGKYIANCDDDDIWHNPDKLQMQIDFMEANPEYGVCHTDYLILNTGTNRLSEVKMSEFTYQDSSLQKIIFNGKFECCIATVVYRKSIIDQYVNLDDYIKYQFGFQDWNTYIILAKYTKFYCLPVVTVTYHRGHESLSNLLSYEKLTSQMERRRVANKYICDLFPDDLVYNKDKYQNFINGQLLNLAYKKRDFSAVKKYAKLLADGGSKSYKVRLAHNKLFFWGFIIVRKLRQRFI